MIMGISMKELKKNLEQFKNGKQTLEQTIDGRKKTAEGSNGE